MNRAAQPPQITFALVQPTEPGNVGAVARSLAAFGFDDLVLIDPPPRSSSRDKALAVRLGRSVLDQAREIRRAGVGFSQEGRHSRDQARGVSGLAYQVAAPDDGAIPSTATDPMGPDVSKARSRPLTGDPPPDRHSRGNPADAGDSRPAPPTPPGTLNPGP